MILTYISLMTNDIELFSCLYFCLTYLKHCCYAHTLRILWYVCNLKKRWSILQPCLARSHTVDDPEVLPCSYITRNKQHACFPLARVFEVLLEKQDHDTIANYAVDY